MRTHIPCPEPGRLRGLIDQSLSEGDQARLIGHLDGCPQCQQQLEQLATGGESWSEALTTVSRVPPPRESALWPTLQKLEQEFAPASRESHDDTPLPLEGNLLAQAKGPPSLPARASPPPLPAVSASRLAVTTLTASGELSLDFLAPTESPDHLGKLGHFEVARVIGRGGMGVVLEGFDTHLQRQVAIKVLDPKLANNEVARKRFCREARAAASVMHEHVVAVLHVEKEETSGLPFLVMQLVAGESLEERLRREPRPDLNEIVRLGMQIAAGLAAAHARGLIHRDVKPANILLERETGRVKLTDFGLARAVEDVKLTQTGFVAGTPLYMSPEQARGEDADQRSDLFSLGVVLYELCTGQPPWGGKSPLTVLRQVSEEPHPPIAKLNRDIPDCLAGYIDQLLTKDPAKRIQTAGEVAAVFAEHLCSLHELSPLQVPALPGVTGSCPTTKKPVRPRSLMLWAVLGGALLFAAGVLAGVGSGWFRGPFSTGPATPDEPPAPAPLAVLNANAGPIWSVGFAPDGATLALGIDDGTVKLWDVEGQRIRGTLNAHRGPIWSLAYAPVGKLLATGSDDAQVKLWELPAGREQKVLKQVSSVRAVAFSPDGKTLATGNRNGEVHLWDVESGMEGERTRGHAGSVVSVVFSPDGATVASAGGDKVVKLWDVKTGQELLTLEGHAGGVYCVAFSPDCKTIASGGWDKTVRLWDVRTGNLLATLQGHSQDVWSVAFSPDGTLLASGSEDHSVRLWEVPSGKDLAVLKAHTGSVYTVRFAPDGRTVASGGRDGMVRLWSVEKNLR